MQTCLYCGRDTNARYQICKTCLGPNPEKEMEREDQEIRVENRRYWDSRPFAFFHHDDDPASQYYYDGDALVEFVFRDDHDAVVEGEDDVD